MVNKSFVVLMSLLLLGSVVFVSASNCGGWFQPACEPELNNLDVDKNVNIGDSFFGESKFTEANQQRLIASAIMPKPTKSLERENLIKRYEFLNDQNKIFYIYLVSYGKVMAYYTAQGKISSINSRLTQEEQIVRDPNCYRGSGGMNCGLVVGSPQLDGSYGTNGDGIFFFTTEGAYVEWNGEYMVSDFPMKLSTPPELVRNI